MRAKRGLPVEVRSMEGLGVTFGRARKRVILGFCTGFFSLVNSVPHGQALEQWSLWLLALSSDLRLGFAARQLAGRAACLSLGAQLYRVDARTARPIAAARVRDNRCLAWGTSAAHS